MTNDQSEGPLPEAGTKFGRRVRERLEKEQVIWLTTVGADGTPQPNPVWFVWESPDTLIVYNRPDAYRLAHVGSRPGVCLHFNANAVGNDIGVFSGTAIRDDTRPPPHEHPTYREKYADGMVRSAAPPSSSQSSGVSRSSSVWTVSAVTPDPLRRSTRLPPSGLLSRHARLRRRVPSISGRRSGR